MNYHLSFKTAFICPFFLIVAQSQSVENRTLIEILTPQFFPPDGPNEVGNILFPPEIVTVETPIAVRYVLVVLLPRYTLIAACDPKALSFLGEKDEIPRRFCKPTPYIVIISYMLHRLLASQFPIEGKRYADFLRRSGLTPFSNSTGKSTEVGWANSAANRLLQYLENDGWNSLGDVTRSHNRLQYEDSTGYKPQNDPTEGLMSLKRPLRWQPLTQSADSRGHFISQVHVTPHIGIRAKPLVLTKKQLAEKTVTSPYTSPNLKNRISKKDEKLMRSQIDDLFGRNRKVTKQQVALAHWWNNKFLSLGSFVNYYSELLEIEDDLTWIIGFGEVLAQHDAILVAWKEKIRHDLTRPTTMIRRLGKGRIVQAFKSFEEGVGMVKAEEWEPLIKAMPHSEFPSASALMCMASMNHLQAQLEVIVGTNGTIPRFELTIPPMTPASSPVNIPVGVKFDTLDGAARSCGDSRLFSGVHFGPSVLAGYKLAEGIGEAAFTHITDLVAGRIPENCERCPEK